MFITHDLSVVKHISDQIAVLYLGQCIELADSKELFKNLQHPYTKALLSAIPISDLIMKEREIKIIKGEVASPIDPKSSCRFAIRCDYAASKCNEADSEFREISSGHFVAYLFAENL